MNVPECRRFLFLFQLVTSTSTSARDDGEKENKQAFTSSMCIDLCFKKGFEKIVEMARFKMNIL